jgi:putative DNA primase/helicase
MKFDLTGWKPDDALAAAEQAFSDWYDRRYGLKRDAADGFVKILQDFLKADPSKFRNPGGASVESEDPMGWHDASLTYIPQSTWSQFFPAAEGTKAATALVDIGMLLSGDEGRHKRKAPRTITGRPRLYTLNTERVMAYKGD